MPLEMIATAFDAGTAAEEIAQRYASVDLARVYAVISYVLDHRREVDEYLMRRRDAAAEVRGEIEARCRRDGSPPTRSVVSRSRARSRACSTRRTT
jgi:hypothetical protein